MYRVIMLLALVNIVAGCGSVIDERDPPPNLEEKDVVQGEVSYIVDGDTFDVVIKGEGEERVRPILVDAPEICHEHSPAGCEPEPYGEKADEFAEELLLGETVFLERDVSERDQYDRLLYYVYLEEGEMYQERLLEEGLAEVVVFEPDVRYKEEFFEIEAEAREAGRGRWSE
ncbi:thermonuclease family protein [Salsuginibacillus kocurii]|uniref:thermonuclease family protein n=1 Tax=Salsuginibacillus kocurii TaxID=427078 RepID=UPI00037FBA00|nr:thermonuclease family protein [Salsuginibacillus kocurii]